MSDGCRYVRKLRLQDDVSPTLLAIAPGPGMLVAHSWADLGLHVFNINGKHLVSCTGNERLSALAVTTSGHFLLTGGLRGVVSLLWLHSLEVFLLLLPMYSMSGTLSFLELVCHSRFREYYCRRMHIHRP